MLLPSYLMAIRCSIGSLPTMRGLAALTAVVAGIALFGCGDDSGAGSNRAMTPSIGTQPNWPSDCVVRLHGKGGNGEPARVDGDITELSPSGNAEGWGARQWVYDSEQRYAQARAIVADALDGAACTRAVVNGFSNGGSFAAALYCGGEQFGGRILGYVIDDPVPDQAVLDCAPVAETQAALYWTGALDEVATPGADCADLDWTCAGETLLGIVRYAEELGTTPTPSPYPEHRWHREAAEVSLWLNR
jgi:pimeloyl-ACP methyl ester carboxylesterase